MKTIQRVIINQELYSLLDSHLNDISQFGVSAEIQSQDNLESITDSITQLFAMTRHDPNDIDRQIIKDATDCLHTIEAFFRLIHSQNIYTDTDKETGRIYKEIRDWYNSVLEKIEPSSHEVWQLISPVSPDTLKRLGQNRFEAYWDSPVPMMDIEILKGTEGVTVVDEPYKVDNLPAGLAVTFEVHQIANK